jgi:hypothetical protein
VRDEPDATVAGVVLIVGVLALLGAAAAAVQTPARTYWPVTVEQVATTMHTHVKVTGRVRLVRKEADGDTHIKLTGVTGYLVAECIPALPCALPTVGQRITVYGISRIDKEHGWAEVHPTERWEPATLGRP